MLLSPGNWLGDLRGSFRGSEAGPGEKPPLYPGALLGSSSFTCGEVVRCPGALYPGALAMRLGSECMSCCGGPLLICRSWGGGTTPAAATLAKFIWSSFFPITRSCSWLNMLLNGEYSAAAEIPSPAPPVEIPGFDPRPGWWWRWP